MAEVFRFAAVEVRADQRQVLVDGRPAAIGARAFDVLLVLLEHRDRVVSKEELIGKVWEGLVVEANNLQVQISALRKLLGVGAIATIAGRGYRFVAPSDRTPSTPTALAAAEAVREPASSLPKPRAPFFGRWRSPPRRTWRSCATAMPSGCSRTRRAWWRPTSRSISATRQRSTRSAGASTASPWLSSWPPRGSACCRWTSCGRGSTTASGC